MSSKKKRSKDRQKTIIQIVHFYDDYVDLVSCLCFYFEAVHCLAEQENMLDEHTKEGLRLSGWDMQRRSKNLQERLYKILKSVREA